VSTSGVGSHRTSDVGEGVTSFPLPLEPELEEAWLRRVMRLPDKSQPGRESEDGAGLRDQRTARPSSSFRGGHPERRLGWTASSKIELSNDLIPVTVLVLFAKFAVDNPL